MKKKRLSSPERRGEIIEIARRLFSEKGFHGTTTRELAEEAGISEALLFKHFPSKEALYKAMLTLCQKSETWSEAEKLLELEPSTSTLAVLLHFIGAKVIGGNEETRMIHRLVLRSLSEDGQFARIIFKHAETTWVAKMNACVQAARTAGDLHETVEKPELAAWFPQHLMVMLAFMHTPQSAVANYKLLKNSVIENAVTFCLRGLGVMDSAIKRYYNPKAFGLLTSKNETRERLPRMTISKHALTKEDRS